MGSGYLTAKKEREQMSKHVEKTNFVLDKIRLGGGKMGMNIIYKVTVQEDISS